MTSYAIVLLRESDTVTGSGFQVKSVVVVLADLRTPELQLASVKSLDRNKNRDDKQ